MKTSTRLLLLVSLMVLFMLPLGATNSSDNATTNYDLFRSNDVAGYQDEATWWNSTFIYRRYFNITEPDVSDRNNYPVHLYLTFDDGHCYRNSIRVLSYNGPGSYTEKEFQTWNTTYYPGGDFVKSTRVSFMIDITKGGLEDSIYIYYAKEDVGSVSYPNFYPFIYRSYTFSLINLVSYYDNNNYLIEMLDTDGVWKDPNLVDTRWSGDLVSPHNTPSGTLDEYENIRYEPTASDYSRFFGYYTVYSNYPLAVSMGQGDKGSNPAVNDWWPGVSELGEGIGTRFILGGVEGFEDRNEGKYWVQAQYDNTEVYAWTVAEVLDTGWLFYNGSPVTSWPAVLRAGEYVSKRDVVYSTYLMVNSTRPVSVRYGDSDATYSRDIGGYFPAVTGELVGYEFYTIDMGNSNDQTRVTNLGDSPVTVEWWRSTGSGWVKGANLTDIPANGSATIPAGSAGSTNPEDILRIRGPAGSKLTVEGLYKPTAVTDWGDWAPTMEGNRFGLDYRIWGGRYQKIMIFAWANAEVQISSYSGSATRYISAGGADFYMPVSSSPSLHDIHSNATISVVIASKFSTSSPYDPSGDQGYGWMVPSYFSEEDDAGVAIASSDEIKLFELDITVRDLDGAPVQGVTVTLYDTNDNLWLDDNGLGRSDTTNVNGLVIFEGLSNITYRIVSQVDAATWLSSSYSHIWIKDTTDHGIDGSVTHVSIELKIADVDIYLDDLMNNPMSDNDNEDTNLRLNNKTGDTNDYIAQGQTDGSGWVHFSRVPQDDYDVYARYAGSLGWLYTYDQMADFAIYSLDSADFNSGSITRAWSLPLITLDVHVTTWDELDASGATIKINNSVDQNEYQITKTADVNGDYSFYRIVNGTWNLDVWKVDDYVDTPLARNNTVSLTDLQGYESINMRLPLSRLIIRVQTGPTTYVEGAQVNVTLKNVGVVAQGTTNSTGHVTFFNIHANMSSPYSVVYNVTVTSGNQENGTINELFVKCDFDYWYINRIYIGVPDWDTAYTELNATSYFVNARWGRNATLSVGWYDKTGVSTSYTTSAIAYDTTSWLNFTIYFQSTVVGSGYWTQAGSEWIGDPSGIHFLLTIDTDFWNMNVSTTAYRIVIEADTSAKDAPSPITIYLTMLPAETSAGVSTSDITEYYGTNGDHLYWMTDFTNGGFVSSLDMYTFVVKSGTTVKNSGTLVSNVNGTYTLPASALAGLGVGSYVITISLEKLNFVNQSITVYATIEEVPMNVLIFNPDDYDWSVDVGSESIVFQYRIDWNSTPVNLAGVSVYIEWITYPGGVSYLNVSRTLTASSGNFTYLFNGDLVPVGTWTVRVTCHYGNYSAAVGTFEPITVSEAPTAFTVPSGTQVVDWTETAEFTVQFTRVGDGVGLEGATVTTNWNGTYLVEYLGNGQYLVSFDTTVPATTYVVTISVSMTNHESKVDTVTIQIRVPISIETEFGSEETPLVAYWTRTFDVTIRLMDLSRDNTTIPLATVTYFWNGVSSGPLAMTETSPGVYTVTLDASDASPLESSYTITIDAQIGISTATGTVFLSLQDVPNEIVLRQGGFVPFYGDIETVWFYWNNTLDGVPITLPSSASFVVEPLGTGIGGLTNYGNGTYSFDVDTKALGMDVDLYNGFYRVRITMIADGFEPVEDVFVFFLMRESPTSLEVVGSTDAVWSEDLTLKVNLWDSRHSELVWLDATVQMVYGSHVIVMDNLGNGTFWTQFDSSLYFTALNPEDDPYDVIIQYTIPNYVDGEITVEVRIDPKIGEISIITTHLLDGIYVGDWSTTVGMQITTYYLGESTHLPEGNATYYWVGYESVTGVFTYGLAPFIYNASVDTSLVPAGLQTLRIEITLLNHTVIPYNLTFDLAPLVATFDTDTSELEAVYGSTESLDVVFTLTHDGTPLTGATISVVWGGVTFPHRVTGVGIYTVSFSPAQVSGLQAPHEYVLNFTMTLQNYTAPVHSITLMLLAPTTLTIDSEISVEYGKSTTILFKYWDTLNEQPVQGATITAQLPDGTPLIVTQYNSTHYAVTIVSSDVGEIRTTPYTIEFYASADLYQSYTSSDPFTVSLFVIEPTYNLPLIGPIPVNTVHTVGFMTLMFLGAVVGAILVRRMRIPYPIKQIDRALKHIEKGKTAKVEKIKTMGQVISELLAPGLAELDIEAPVIESGPIDTYEEILDAGAEELLDELDALDGLGLDEEAESEVTDFEAELDAELESAVEEGTKPEEPIEEAVEAEAEPEPEPELEFEAEAEVEPEVIESEPEPEPEAEVEAEPEVVESEPEPETVVEEPEVDESPFDETTSEPEAEVEPEPEPVEEAPVEEPAAEAPEVEEEDLESKLEEEALEPQPETEPEPEELDEPSAGEVEPEPVAEVEESTPEEETPAPEPEVSEEKAPSAESKKMSKKELIELLPEDIREKYSDAELRKLSKSELYELIEYMEELEE
ncbi:MAG: hypothetical protein ACTSV3_05525 [Candidatus Thorarchaeota archaeon]|nr:MAG: hypothetical protein DRP09_06570 [Candidatus Thorarchaeota archaeon]